jgi:hypothetical protein
MIPFRAGTLVVFATALTSCSHSDAGTGTTFLDSAGVTLATAESPLWAPGEGWRVTERPLLQIGVVEGPEEYLFSDLVGAVRLSDGRIVVADRGFAELRFFNAAGTFLYRTGSSGEGPGEFRSLDFIGWLPGDSLVTYDRRLLRVQLFDPAGMFVRSFQMESAWPGFFPETMIGVLDSSRVTLALAGIGTEAPYGLVRWPPEIVAALDLRTGELDSLCVVPGPEAQVTDQGGGGYSHGTVVFGKENEFAASLGGVAIISTDTFAVRLLGTDGATRRIIRRLIEPEAVTREHLETYFENVVHLVFPAGSNPAPEDVANFRRSLEGRARASTLPLLRSVQIDSEGNVWVEPYFHVGGSPVPFQVFSSDGTWLGEVAFPPGQGREVHPRRAPSFQIGSDFILGVWMDAMDVQYVRLYGLEKD